MTQGAAGQGGITITSDAGQPKLTRVQMQNNTTSYVFSASDQYTVPQNTSTYDQATQIRTSISYYVFEITLDIMQNGNIKSWEIIRPTAMQSGSWRKREFGFADANVQPGDAFQIRVYATGQKKVLTENWANGTVSVVNTRLETTQFFMATNPKP